MPCFRKGPCLAVEALATGGVRRVVEPSLPRSRAVEIPVLRGSTGPAFALICRQHGETAHGALTTLLIAVQQVDSEGSPFG